MYLKDEVGKGGSRPKKASWRTKSQGPAWVRRGRDPVSGKGQESLTPGM